ncbi:hypothetical protein QBC34DRAFT_97915 [Podospora aff. communis PSN243]|uniref:Nephrocystin 3-like N-terminal domain-containing protein n=1 Tax=Podospora aff. communis PSN243 TaxID=3040156 RepID=A0AAV9GM79_9PEZI|nr:hypothetical protein QBC34DRAFT_97915 [Podospora aff. communis PSN243]
MSGVSQPNSGTVYRVRGVPLGWDGHHLSSFITNHPAIAPEPRVHSLAVEIHGRSKTATLTFTHSISWPDTHQASSAAGGTYRIALPKPLGDHLIPDQYLIFDTDFHGVTTLSAPPTESDGVDIIAISGIGGHAFGSFKERGGHHMWLRDAVPGDLRWGGVEHPIARIMIYGFSSRMANSRSVQSLEDLSNSFRDSLLPLSTETNHRPIIFIAHSLGGLIVKQMLISLSKSKDNSDDHLRIFQRASGVLFFGVPHDGIDIASFVMMVGDGPNRSLVESLSRENSQVLDIQRREFQSVFKKGHACEIVCFYETEQSPTASKGEDGVWRMLGPKTTLVSKASATHCGPSEGSPEYICAIPLNHSDMVKFGPEDPNYRIVLSRLKVIAKLSLDKYRGTSQEHIQACLRSLAFPEMDNRFKDIDAPTSGTCEWLLRHLEYVRWKASHNSLLWIRGKPGSGKSTLLRHLLGNAPPTGHRLESRPLILSYFFHARGNELQKTSIGFFRTIAHQLLCEAPFTLTDLVVLFQQRCQEIGSPGADWEWHVRDLEGPVISSIRKVLEKRTVQLFVDALDEAGEEAAVELVGIFKSWLQSGAPITTSKWQICFSCRHCPILDVDHYGTCTIYTERENSEDISTYVKTRGLTMPAPIRQTIIDRASGVFMWALLTVSQALTLSRQGFGWGSIQHKVNATPKELGELYRNIIRDVVGKNGRVSLRLFKYLIFSVRPLTLEEMRWALILSDDHQLQVGCVERWRQAEDYDSDMEKRIRGLSGGLAEVTEAFPPVIQFIHQSVSDYLNDEGLWILSGLPVLGPSDPNRVTIETIENMTHFDLAAACLTYLGSLSQLSNRKHAQPPINDRAPRAVDELEFGEYAIMAWPLHMERMTDRCVMRDFLLFIRWPSTACSELWSRAIERRRPQPELDREWCQEGATLLHCLSAKGLDIYLEVALQLVEHAVRAIKVNEADRNGVTALHLAAVVGRPKVVRLLLTQGANPNAYSFCGGLTPLHHAAQEGHKDVARLLLDGGASVNVLNEEGETPLVSACRYNSIGFAQLLQRQTDNAQTDVAKLLLERGANVRLYGREPALFLAVMKGDVNLTRRLLLYGSDNNDRAQATWSTPLHVACRSGEERITRLLLDHGADPNVMDVDHNTPLHFAISSRLGGSTTRMLLEAGANANAQNRAGKTPLHRIVERACVLPVSWDCCDIRLLLEHGADVGLANHDRKTALIMAISGGLREIVELLSQAEGSPMTW